MSDLAAFILERHGIDCVPGRKHKCPKCGHKTFSMKKDGTVAKCFHPSCSWFMTPWDIDPKPSLHKLLSVLLREWHSELLTTGDLHQQAAMKYLLEKRGLAQAIIESASIGLVPQELGIESVLNELLNELRTSTKNGPGRPTKDAFDPHRYADWLQEQGQDLIIKAEKAKGWIAFFYQDARGRYCALHFRKPGTKLFSTFKPKDMGLFGRNIFVPLRSRAHSLLNYIGLVTEGEFDCLKIQSVLVNAKREPALVVATAGTSLVDIPTLKKAIPKPVICPDNDEAGKEFVEHISHEMNCEVCSLPPLFKDIDQYLTSFESPDKAFKALCTTVQAREPKFQPAGSVKKHINQIRSGIIKDPSRGDVKMKKHEIDQQVAETVINEMTTRGAFYRDGDLPYYFSLQTNEVMLVSPGSKGICAILSEFGLNATDRLHRFVVEELYQHGIRSGEQKAVHQFSYLRYSTGEPSALYLASDDNMILRVTRDSGIYVANGTDGILCLASKEHIPASIPLEAREGTELLDNLILNRAPFKEDRLSKQENVFLLKCYIMALIMRDIIPHRPLLALIGPKGSGKTTLLQMIGKMLYDPEWDVTAIKNKEDDFDSLLTNQVLAGLDNVDVKINWLNDRLAVAATGGTISKKELYTTNREIRYPITAWIALTSRTPSFRREDVADRLLILETLSIRGLDGVKFRSSMDFFHDVESSRTELWAELISLCRSILGVIDSVDIRSIVVEGARMQDFARFTWIVGKALGCESMVQGIWDKLKTVQTDFALQADPFLPVHRIWLKNNPGREISANKLDDELCQIALQMGREWPYRGGRSIGQKIKNLEERITEYCDIRLREGPTKQKLYTFILQESVDSESDSGPIP